MIPNKDQPTWNEVKVFRNEENGIAVIVNRSNRIAGETPLYSVRLVKTTDDGRHVPFIRIFRDRNYLTHAKLSNPFANIVSELMNEAEHFIEIDMESYVQEDMDYMREREEHQANYGKPVTRVTGKTERKRMRKVGE